MTCNSQPFTKEKVSTNDLCEVTARTSVRIPPQELTEGKLIRIIVNLTEISEQLGISKTPLRDALIQLEAEGFVDHCGPARDLCQHPHPR